MFGIYAVSIMRIAALIAEGAVTTTSVQFIICITILIAALYLGKKFILKLDENFLRKLIVSLLFISGITLIFKN
jgi:uncharacterized membrane protein YfcA